MKDPLASKTQNRRREKWGCSVRWGLGVREKTCVSNRTLLINIGILIKFQAAPADTHMRVEAATQAVRPLG